MSRGRWEDQKKLKNRTVPNNPTILDKNNDEVSEVSLFLRDINPEERNPFFKEEFDRLIRTGQVMVVPGLKKHHAGGEGIYLTVNYTSVDLLRKIFAKCGFTEKENKTVEFFSINGIIIFPDFRTFSKFILKLQK